MDKRKIDSVKLKKNMILELTDRKLVRFQNHEQEISNREVFLDAGVYFISFYKSPNLLLSQHYLIENEYMKIYEYNSNCDELINSIYVDETLLIDRYDLREFKFFIKTFNPSFLDSQLESASLSVKEKLLGDFAKIYSLIITYDDFHSSSESSDVERIEIFKKNSIYTAIGYTGFVLTNLKEFNRVVTGYQNLIVAFTETDLADRLLNDGLMVISWGLTPYQYFIGFKDNFPSFLLNSKYKTNFHGSYKIKSDLTSLSLIKGEQLDNWNNKELPFSQTINIPDNVDSLEFNVIDLDLYIVENDSLGSEISPVCFIILDINTEDVFCNIKPALNYNIFDKTFISE